MCATGYRSGLRGRLPLPVPPRVGADDPAACADHPRPERWHGHVKLPNLREMTTPSGAGKRCEGSNPKAARSARLEPTQGHVRKGNHRGDPQPHYRGANVVIPAVVAPFFSGGRATLMGCGEPPPSSATLPFGGHFQGLPPSTSRSISCDASSPERHAGSQAPHPAVMRAWNIDGASMMTAPTGGRL